MGAFNVVTTTARCRRCASEGPVRVQFKYGSAWQHEYHMGDTLRWEGNSIGVPGRKRVVVDGVAEPCAKCGADDEWSFCVFVEYDLIVAVEPATGIYDFPGLQRGYIVVEE